ncbi:MAG: fused MFS/spermidine synthase [Syntrophales bacterium]
MRTRDHAVLALTVTVFIGAFLLFSMEPFIGRILAPLFGGSVYIWLICLSFYQLMLLIGYVYAHFGAKVMGYRHIMLLILPFMILPFAIPTEVPAEGHPLASLVILLSSFALPFALLSTTAVTAQIWLVQFRRTEEPYALYGASNTGALLALVTYPILIEPLLGLRWQAIAWNIGYALYIIFAALSYYLIRPKRSGKEPLSAIVFKANQGDKPSRKHFAYWILLSAMTSAFLVTVTHVIAADMGSFPLVWILPLALYLGSYIITFRKSDIAYRFISNLYPEIILLGLLLFLIPATYYLLHIGHLIIFFAVCILIHRILYEERPLPEFLSVYYLAVALGGLIGSLAVSLAAPLVFSRLWEYPLLLIAISLIFLHRYAKTALSFWRRTSWPLHAARLLPVGLLIGMIILVGRYSAAETVQAVHRNYYGISRVIDAPVTGKGPSTVRILSHGSTIHGIQFLDQEKRKLPTLYYHPTGGLADAFAAMPPDARIAAIGLGSGTIGAYTRPGDILDFYEINPDMEMLARRWFSFLADAKARTSVIIADGRVALHQYGKQDFLYDIVFVDAFSGEGIPAHLLTEEGMNIYLRRLKNNGLILFHITNRYYDLRPVIKTVATRLKLHGAMKSTLTMRKESSAPVHTDYMVLTLNGTALKALLDQNWIALGNSDGIKECQPWTDDYVNILVPLAAKLNLAIF